MDETVLYDLSYGLFAIGAKDGDRDCGCIVNTVVQISIKGPLIALSMNKENYTYDLINKNKRFSVSILSEESDPGIISNLGFVSGKDNDKWENISKDHFNGLPIASDNANGWLECEMLKQMDADTHYVILAKVVDTRKGIAAKPMTYNYYHNVIKGKAPKKASTYRPEEEKQSDQKHWTCTICGYVYEGDDFETLPADWVCPICKQGKDKFILK